MRLLRLCGLLAALGAMAVTCGAMKQQSHVSSGRTAATTDSDKKIHKALRSMIEKNSDQIKISEKLQSGNPSPVEVARRINLYDQNDADQRSALDYAAAKLNFDVLAYFLSILDEASKDIFAKERAFDRAASQEVSDDQKINQNHVLRLLLNSGVDGKSAKVRANLAKKPTVVARIQSAIDDNVICQRLHAIALSGSADGYDDVMRDAPDAKEKLRRLSLNDTEADIAAVERAAAHWNKAFLEKIISMLEQDDKDWALVQAANKKPQDRASESKKQAVIKFLIENKANLDKAIKQHLSRNNDYAVAYLMATLPTEVIAAWVDRAEKQIKEKGVSASVHADPGLLELFKALAHTTENKEGVFSVDAIKKIVTPDARICCMGDIHGSLGALIRNLKKLKELNFLSDKFKLVRDKDLMIFTGDYVSRGKHSVGVIYTLLLLVAANPGQVVLLRGNHEIKAISGWARYGITNQFERDEPRGELEDLYGEKNRLVWAQIDQNFFQKLPYVCFLGILGPENKIEWLQCCHGGVDPVFDHTSFLNNKDVLTLPDIFTNLDYRISNPKFAGLEKAWPRLLALYVSTRKKRLAPNFLKAEKELGNPTDNGFIWSEFSRSLASGTYEDPAKYFGGLAIPDVDAAGHAPKLGLVGWIRGHQHDNFGLKIGGNAHWLSMLSGEPQQIGAKEDALWTFKFSQAAKVPVFTLSTASEANELFEPYDSFIILEPNNQRHDEWMIKVYEKKIVDKTPFWDPLKSEKPAEAQVDQLSLPDPVYLSLSDDETIRSKLREIAQGKLKLDTFDDLMKDIKSFDEERKREILRRLRLATPQENVSALESAGARVNLEFIKKVWPYLAEGDKNWVLIQSVKRDNVDVMLREATIDFLVSDFPDREKGAKGANLDAVIAYYQERSRQGEAVQDQITRLNAAKKRLTPAPAAK